jgi:hypothetical protein
MLRKYLILPALVILIGILAIVMFMKKEQSPQSGNAVLSPVATVPSIGGEVIDDACAVFSPETLSQALHVGDVTLSSTRFPLQSNPDGGPLRQCEWEANDYVIRLTTYSFATPDAAVEQYNRFKKVPIENIPIPTTSFQGHLYHVSATNNHQSGIRWQKGQITYDLFLTKSTGFDRTTIDDLLKTLVSERF